MESSFAVNKYLHTVASVGFLFTLNYDARNHELKISKHCFSGEKETADRDRAVLGSQFEIRILTYDSL